MYKATATIYVVSRNDSVLNFSDLQVGSELTSDYIKVFEMWEVHEKVISALNLDYTYSEMASMLSVTNTADTRMLDITVTDSDPEEAAAIANEYAEVGTKYISEKMKTDEPTLMSSARVPANPFSPSKAKNIPVSYTHLTLPTISASIPAWSCWLPSLWQKATSPKKAAPSNGA